MFPHEEMRPGIIKAKLCWEGVVVKIMPIPSPVRVIQICKSVLSNLGQMSIRNINDPPGNDVVDVDIMRFVLHEPDYSEPNCYIYEFEKYAVKVRETMDDKPLNLGFVEPDDKVNLDHLKKKLKKGLKIKNLLLRFYQK